MLAALLSLLAAATPGPIEESVVRVQVYRARYDWSMPWRVNPVESSFGSGFLIEGGRILTNAHVVRDARQVLVKRHHAADPFVATIEAEGDDCDLAVLKVDDPAFYKGLTPLKMGDLPGARTRVTTYGFPLGGDEVSSTAGIVSRIEWRVYVHSGFDWHLVVQTDAAINPGNSGGPVLLPDAKVAGVAFMGIPGLDNVGFFIPAPVVKHFIDDLKDGKYDGFPDGGFRSLELISPAFRRERGLPAGKSGVAVDAVAPGGTAEGVLVPGDVLTAVEGAAVADDGSIALGPARISFAHAMDVKQLGEPLKLRIWRDGKEQELTAKSRRLARGDRQRSQYGKAPRYLVYAGLVFMPLDAEYLRTWGDWIGMANRELVWHQLFREWEAPQDADREVVVLARVLRHPVNSQMAWTGGVIVKKANGKPISGLADLAEVIAANKEKFHTFEFEANDGVEALDREQADVAHTAIMKTYGIPRDRNL